MKPTPTEYLFHLELHGIKLGLENIQRMLAQAGDPHLRYPVVHVAGSNGKGSVVAMLDSILRRAGYRTGRFTSPHLVSVCERFIVDGEPIAARALDDLVARVRANVERAGLTPTFFEANTAIAFEYFAAQQVDVALIEVGLGGRFDSTNVVQPIATAITNVALEHTEYLGDTIEAIAYEKAGILKPGVPAVVAETSPEALEVITARAAEVGAPLFILGKDFEVSCSAPAFEQRIDYRGAKLSLSDAPLALSGSHQATNAGVALALAEGLTNDFPRLEDPKLLAEGLATAQWPCRLERFGSSPEIIVDVAHNAAGAQTLAEALHGPAVFLLAVALDKNADGILDALRPKADSLVLTQFSNRRALPAKQLSAHMGNAPHHCEPDLHKALTYAFNLARERGLPLVIAGSLFLAGEVRAILTEDFGAPPLRF